MSWSSFSRQTMRGPKLPMSKAPVLHLPFVDRVSGRLSYARGGNEQGKKVICVHGCPGSMMDFKYLAWHLEENAYDVVRLDFPGHGQNGSADARLISDPPSAEGLAKVVIEACLDIFGSKSQILIVSHSLGSHVALHMAAMRPELFSGILLLAPAGISPHRALQPWPFVGAIGRHLVKYDTGILTSIIKLILPYLYRVMFPGTSGAEAIYSQRRIGYLDFDSLAVAIDRLHPALQVAVVYGTADSVVLPVTCEELLRKLRSTHLQVVESLAVSGGHTLQKTHAKDIYDFMRQTVSKL
ncbi:putative hydrolase YugF [Diplonema papillatum]|nr:putative hydrolase YugF [Diplonema papillatum]